MAEPPAAVPAPAPAGAGGATRTVRVVPDVAAVRKAFDYAVPPALDGEVRVGTCVRVVLHNRRLSGWVVADELEAPGERALLPILAVRGWGPPPAVVDLARWAAWRWAGPWSRLLSTASSSALVRALPVPPVRKRSAPAPLRSSRASAVAAHRPRARGPGAVADGLAAEALGGGTTVVRLGPAHDPFPVADAAARLVPDAARRPGGALSRRPGGALSRHDTMASAGALVLLPAQEAAARMAARLRVAGHDVALLPGQWARARAGGCVAVGSRAAAFAPLPALCSAVVVDAHDEAYHEERTPTWCAWQVVAERARRDGAPCALVSPCPTLEVLAAGRLVTPGRGDERSGWPPVEVVDRRADDPRSGLYSERLVTMVRWAAGAPGRRVLCVLNRTGRVRLLACASCGELARCERCGAAVESRRGGGLVCRRCGTERPEVCAACGATRLKARRVGVTRAREELAALAGTSVDEVWGPPGTGALDAPEELEGAPVVVGTEAVLHRVDAADAVVFLEFDAELLAPRLRAAEEALALLARAARLVASGPDDAPSEEPGAVARRSDDRAPRRASGRLVVQTRMPHHPALVAAVAADPGMLAASEARLRGELRLPPVSAVALVSGPAADAYGAALAADGAPDVEVRGPVDGVWSLRATHHTALCDLLERTPRPPGRLRVEVDPVRA